MRDRSRKLLSVIGGPKPNNQFRLRGIRPAPARAGVLLRKEVIQPQVPLRLPCYDFIPITSLTVGRCLHKGWRTYFGQNRLS
jgi:hypothetical protein